MVSGSYSDSELIKLLRTCPAFAGTPEKRLRPLLENAEVVKLPARQLLFQEGRRARHLYVLVDGIMRIFHAGSSGRQVTVKHIVAPSTVAEVEVITSSAFLESVESLSPCTLVRIEAAPFVALLSEDLASTRAVLQDIAQRFCSVVLNEHTLFYELPVRLASLLLTYADWFGVRVEDGVRIRLHVKQEDLANSLGVVVRSVSRTMSRWKRQGWISSRKGWIVLHRVDELERLCHDLRFPGVAEPAGEGEVA